MSIAPVSAFYDMLSAFYAFFGEKSLLGQASESGRRMAGQLFENSAEAGWVGKTEGGGDFGYALGTGAEKVLGLRDSSAVEIILLSDSRFELHSGSLFGTIENYRQTADERRPAFSGAKRT